jgi:uncharacterized protein YjiS (DUF1127 family)
MFRAAIPELHVQSNGDRLLCRSWLQKWNRTMTSLTGSDVTDVVDDLNVRRDRALARFADLALALLWKPAEFYRNRREMAELAAMSDRELSDIGLTRCDLMSIYPHPSGRDPTLAHSDGPGESRRRRAR